MDPILKAKVAVAIALSLAVPAVDNSVFEARYTKALADSEARVEAALCASRKRTEVIHSPRPFGQAPTITTPTTAPSVGPHSIGFPALAHREGLTYTPAPGAVQRGSTRGCSTSG